MLPKFTRQDARATKSRTKRNPGASVYLKGHTKKIARFDPEDARNRWNPPKTTQTSPRKRAIEDEKTSAKQVFVLLLRTHSPGQSRTLGKLSAGGSPRTGQEFPQSLTPNPESPIPFPAFLAFPHASGTPHTSILPLLQGRGTMNRRQIDAAVRPIFVPFCADSAFSANPAYPCLRREESLPRLTLLPN